VLLQGRATGFQAAAAVLLYCTKDGCAHDAGHHVAGSQGHNKLDPSGDIVPLIRQQMSVSVMILKFTGADRAVFTKYDFQYC